MLYLLACAPEPAPIAWCEGEVQMEWDIGGDVDVFPDDHYTTPADTPTGIRVSISPDDYPFLGAYPEGFVAIFDDLSTLDGWGLSAGMWFRADAALPSLPVVRVVADGEDWPVDLSTTDDGATLLIQPRRPFPEATEVAVVATHGEGACIAPAPHTRALLDPASTEPQAARFQAALAGLAIDPVEVAAMSVFTTQSGTWLSRQVAADIAARAYTFQPGGCEDHHAWRECEGLVEVMDYREENRIVPPSSVGEPLASYDLPVRVWLPPGVGPFPTVLCGHGLGGDRGQCDDMADIGIPEGFAVVAVDAVEHGDHPGRTEADLSILDDLMILAITVSPPGLDARRLRDNFRQSAWDKLQVIHAIQSGLDADSDGVVDLDPEHLAYAGVSLGAIMGPEPLALSEALDGAVLLVGGARISSIISDSPTFSVIVDLMRPEGTSDGEVDRFFPVLQTVIDAGDPASFAPYVAGNRWAPGAPSVLNAMSLDDEIVPNSTNEVLARALGLPGVGSELWPIADVSFVSGPVSANLESGATGGTLQFAYVREGEGWVAAEHDNLHSSVTGAEVMVPFLRSVLRGETPVITEPERP